jgi:organic radical activating enzyme
MNYKLNSIFTSLQGEGRNVGRPATFIRFASCNLRCPWCDTHRTIHLDLSLGELLLKVKHREKKMVIITGGEPSIQPGLSDLVRKLKEEGHYVALETNGLEAPPEPERFDYIACSPKAEYASRYRDDRMLHKANEVRIVAENELVVSFCRKMREQIKADDYYISPLDQNGKIHYHRALSVLSSVNRLMTDVFPPWSLSIQMHKVIGIR